MFKKSLIALTVLGAFSANATTINHVLDITKPVDDITAIDVVDATADVTISQEGLAGATGAKISYLSQTIGTDKAEASLVAGASNLAMFIKNDVTVQNGDFVYIDFPGAVFDTTVSPSIVALEVDVAVGGTDNDVDAVASNLSFIKYEGTSIVFGATAPVPAGTILHLNAVTLKSGSAASIKPTFKATNTTIGDYAKGASKKAILTTAELSAVKVVPSTGALNGVIDVSKDRLQFKDGTVDALTLALTVKPTDKLTTTAMDFDVTLKGDFSVLDTDNDGKLEAGEGSVTTSGGKTPVWATGLSSVTFKDVAVNATEAVTVALPATLANRKTLTPQNFQVTVTADYTAAAATNDVAVLTDAAAGGWTLNGSQVQVPYMPFGENTQVIMRLTNTSSKTGDLSVRYMVEGGASTWTEIPGAIMSIGPGVTNIADEVMDAIKTAANIEKGKVAIELTTNVPGDSVEINALFKVVSETDRATVRLIKKS
tara:strand:- start:15593 stop:17044 length:1452 start_codon:yes stop_codon:yes gene_type:complete